MASMQMGQPDLEAIRGGGASRRRPGSVRGPLGLRRQKVGIAIAAAAALAAGIAGATDGAGDGAGKTPPPSVVVAAVAVQDVSAEHRYIGTIKAIQSVDLKARVEGFLERVAFDQGSAVEAGQMLYQIEQAPFQAKFASAEGQLAAAKAKLASAKATLEDKQADFERQSTLVKQGDVSQTAFDRAKAERDEAKAAVEEAKASIQQAQAAIESAEIDLGYTLIRSPIDGRIGATQYTKGNLVDSSSGTLATVVQLDPIRAVFSIPSSDYVKVQQRAAGASTQETQTQFAPELILPTGKTYPHQGKLAFVDNQVDPGTGTIAVYADFPNPDHLLLPGQFVTALVRSAEPQREPVVPAAAIQRTRDGAQVYLVGQDNRIAVRQIKTGVQTGNGYAVTSGLQGGEIVVVSGIQKVKPGVKVKTVKQSEAAPMGKALSIDSSGSGSSGDAATDKADPPAGSNDGQSGEAGSASEGRDGDSNTANAADDN
ncbi:MAG: efflux RND transporter periplasmic adaptor subunit [Gammaproteobacteria bacterium]|jgi:membrane fusion protein (multidrug efflux system)|nr:efflux RND transporter periplasmic adaptor subunit [Gammaproteobacteria bacterium]